jgi:hypothetical protein
MGLEILEYVSTAIIAYNKSARAQPVVSCAESVSRGKLCYDIMSTPAIWTQDRALRCFDYDYYGDSLRVSVGFRKNFNRVKHKRRHNSPQRRHH